MKKNQQENTEDSNQLPDLKMTRSYSNDSIVDEEAYK